MSIFHSTVSRRSFMKLMAATVGGVGGAAIVTPVFHDIDELASSNVSTQKRPWYVKERDLYNPTTEIDWSLMKRRDPTDTGQDAVTRTLYYGKDRVDNASKLGAVSEENHLANKDPGYTYRTLAMKASMTRGWPAYVSQGWAGPTNNSSWKGTAYKGVQTPEERGESKWTGSPEEASKILTAFMRFAGAAISGYGELDQRIRTQVISTNVKNHSSTKIVYEDVPIGYEASGKRVIPTKNMWYISNFEEMIVEFARMTPALYNQGGLTDPVAPTLKPSTFNFLRYLGYQYLGNGGDDGTPFVEGAAANLSGVAESSREGLYCISPEYGPIGRLHNYLTDLPLAPTNPIDAGIFKFCHSCHKCADNCPSKSISQEKEPSWELPSINGVACNFHNVGTKEFWGDSVLCNIYQSEAPNCKLCWGNCTFTVNSKSMVHELVKTTIVNTSLFNSFFYKMGEAFGYGPDPQKAEDWWDQSLPVLGIDTTRVAFSGGYRK